MRTDRKDRHKSHTVIPSGQGAQRHRARLCRVYRTKLSSASGIKIASVDSLIAALENRLDFFVSLGCRASDHGLEYPPFREASESETEATFKKALKGQAITKAEDDAFRARMFIALAKAYAKRDVAMQLHMAAIRNNNPRMFSVLGPDTGYDAAHDHQTSENLAKLLGLMEKDGFLPKTILYTLNPKDYYPLGTLIGCYPGRRRSRENTARFGMVVLRSQGRHGGTAPRSRQSR